MTVDYCATPGCTGHLGKFSDCVSEAVADHAAEWADDQTGDTDWSSGHLAMITFDDADTLPVDGDRSVPILAGTYLVWTATTGRVHVDRDRKSVV